jgi:hypothetical protein
MAVTLSRSLLRLKTSPDWSWIRLRISSCGSRELPVTSTPPTLNWGPSTTTIRMVARAFSRSTSVSDFSTRACT